MSDHFVRPDVRAFLDFLNNLPGQKAFEVPLEEARNMMHASRHVADAPVGELAVIRDLQMEGPGGALKLRLYDAREERGPGPLMVFYHGGGWVLGDLDTHEPFCAEIARQMDLPVVAVDYRLAPEHPFPAAADDAIAATRWLATASEALGREVTGLVPFGDSAGGNLAIVATLALRDEPAAVPVLAQWPIYPGSEPTRSYPSRKLFKDDYLLSDGSIDWFDKCYAGDRQDWRFAPLVKDQAGMPPTLITTAALDPIRDQGRVYAAALVQAGVDTIYLEAPGTIHGFMNLRKAIPSTDGDIARSVAALKFLLAGSDAVKDLTGYTYRPAAGIMLVNGQGKVWVGQRLDSTLEAWQMPQGGLDEGEDAQEGALRELEEETGIPRGLVEIVARAPEELYYDLPEDLIGVVWKQKWRGQRQTWFLARFLGRDEDVNLQTAEPEFRAWRWAEVDDLPRLIVPFKKRLYEDVIAAFREHLPRA